jgi:hypothetical protein
VVRALVALCEARDLPHTLQSGELKEDIQTLMGAHTLVAGRGTFIPAVVGLSPQIKRSTSSKISSPSSHRAEDSRL